MIFRLEKLIPLPMVDLLKEDSSIWGADSFSFIQGQKYQVEAASGKGKTSLLSIMYGIRKDFLGDLYIDDIPVRKLKAGDWTSIRKNSIAYIFQGLELFDELSAQDNILLKNRITGSKTREQILEMAERLDIDSFLGKKCLYLSYGQKQRIAIIRALCQPFDFLFADECFSHLDRKNSIAAMALIQDECKIRGAGLIFTSLENLDHPFDVRVAI